MWSTVLVSVLPLAQVNGSDPWGALLAPLGVTGLVSAVLVMWQRDTAQQRDRFMAVAENAAPALVAALDAVKQSEEANRQTAVALAQVTEALRQLPDAQQVARVEYLLQQLDDDRRKAR